MSPDFTPDYPAFTDTVSGSYAHDHHRLESLQQKIKDMSNMNKQIAKHSNAYEPENKIVQDTKVNKPYRVEMQVHGTITVVNCDTKSDAKERAKCFIRAFDDTPFDASAIVSRNVPNSVSGNSDPEKLCTFVNVFRQEVYE